MRRHIFGGGHMEVKLRCIAIVKSKTVRVLTFYHLLFILTINFITLKNRISCGSLSSAVN